MLIKEVGDGTFGSVWRAINKQTGEVVSICSYLSAYIEKNCEKWLFSVLQSSINQQVAIKKMKKKYYTWEECVNLREVKVMYP